MATVPANRALQITAAGAYQRVPAAGLVEVGAGITSSGANLTITPDSGVVQVVGAMTVSSNLTVSGNLTILGTQTSIASTVVTTADRFMSLNAGYTVTGAALSGGFVLNADPQATTTTVNGSFTTSTVVTTGSGTFSAGNIIQISGSTNNNGLYEVLTHVGTTLTIKGAGVAQDFVQNVLVAGTTDGATITKVKVSALRSSGAGVWDMLFGDTTPLTSTAIGVHTGTGVAGQVTTWSGTNALAGSANLTFTGGALTISSSNLVQSGGTISLNATGAASLDSSNSTLALGTTGATTVTVGRTSAPNTSTAINGTILSLTGTASSTWQLTGGTSDLTITAGRAFAISGTGNSTIATSSTGTLGISTASGTLTVSSATGGFALAGASSSGTAASTINANGGNLTISSTAVITMQSTGAGGNLVLSSVGNTAYSSSAGTVVMTGAIGVTVNATANSLNLQTGATTRLSITAGALVIQAGATLSTTGTGQINLPQNASARFQIEGVNTTATVTAANLTTLTDGSVTALHGHANAVMGLNDSAIVVAGEALVAGDPVVIVNASGVPTAFKTDADNIAGLRHMFVGFNVTAQGTIGQPLPGGIRVAGDTALVDAIFDSVPAVGDVGKPVFLTTTTPGKISLTAPAGTGANDTAQRQIGILTKGATGAIRVLIQVGPAVIV